MRFGRLDNAYTMHMNQNFTVFIHYGDESEFSFEVTVDGKDQEKMAVLCMITRGTLMASGGKRAICYNDEGFDVCSYIK